MSDQLAGWIVLSVAAFYATHMPVWQQHPFDYGLSNLLRAIGAASLVTLGWVAAIVAVLGGIFGWFDR